MQKKIDEYFHKCDGEPLLKDDGSPFLNKYGEPIIIGARPPTTAGLAFALGFNSRMTLHNYRKKKAFREILDSALLRIEQYTEERLFDKDGCNGAKFSLQNNFKWSEDKEEKSSAPPVSIIFDIPSESHDAKTDAVTEQEGDCHEGEA